VAYAPVKLTGDSAVAKAAVKAPEMKNGKKVSAPPARAQPPSDEEEDEEDMDEEEDEEDGPAGKNSRMGKKMALPGLDSDDEDEDGDGDAFGDDDDEEDEDEEGDDEFGPNDLDDEDYAGGDFEAAAKRLKSKRARIAAEAEAELRLQAGGETEAFTLPTDQELAEERAQPPNLPSLKRRIADIITVLTDFRNRRDPLRARSDYVDVLSGDCAEYFGYNRELIDRRMLELSRGKRQASSSDYSRQHVEDKATRFDAGAHCARSERGARGQVDQGGPQDQRVKRAHRSNARVPGRALHAAVRCITCARTGACTPAW
jgi:ribosomal RNA methyltransferase Nop2